jgi:cation:H+ antiporter
LARAPLARGRRVTAYILLFIGGVGVLYFGAEWLVRGTATLAAHLGVSPIVLGLTVVALGTSAPELVVSLVATFGGVPDVAVGNVMGSNLANLGLILGISALVKPLTVSARVVTREVPVMLLLTAVLLPVIWDLQISRFEGFFLLTLLAAYLAFVLQAVKGEGEEVLAEFQQFAEETTEPDAKGFTWDFMLVVAGVIGLVLGGVAIVESATQIATLLGISPLLIGVTVVAVGTSLPELATSIVAAFRNEADIAVGNVIGSNVFNLAAILGTTAALKPLEVNPKVLEVHFPAVMILSVMLVPLVRANLVIRRREGVILLATYATLGGWIVVSGGLSELGL